MTDLKYPEALDCYVHPAKVYPIHLNKKINRMQISILYTLSILDILVVYTTQPRNHYPPKGGWKKNQPTIDSSPRENPSNS
jgi:hypothetical protein